MPNKKITVQEVGIRPLVVYDFFFGGIAVIAGIWILLVPGTAAAMAVFGIVSFFLGVLLIGLGAILFTRQLWAYYTSLVGHGLLFFLQIASIGLQATNAGGKSGQPGDGNGVSGGICGLVLAALCVHHAWKLVQQEREALEAARLAGLENSDEPDVEVEPGWDEANKK